MIQIIPENRKPRFSDQLMSGLSRGAQVAATEIPQMLMGRHQERSENSAIRRNTGLDLSGLSPELKKVYLSQHLKSSGHKPDLSGAVNALNTMESMLGKKGIGLAGGWNFSEDARQNRGQFEALNAALLPIFKSIFPRGMTEKELFMVKNEYLPQVGDTEARIRGKIEGLKQMMETGRLPEKSFSEKYIENPNSIFKSSPAKRKSLEEIFG